MTRNQTLKDQMERIYSDVSIENIPWHRNSPPEILTQLVVSGRLQPCKGIEFGCGLGSYVRWFFRQGFDMAGVDISETAIGLAREKGREEGVQCRFWVGDVAQEIPIQMGTFDFAYDWELLHHIFPPARSAYVQNVHGVLRPGGIYLSVCFSEDSDQFGGTGKYRRTPLGTDLYFSSVDELRDLFSPFFSVEELKIITIEGKPHPHRAIYAFLTKPL